MNKGVFCALSHRRTGDWRGIPDKISRRLRRLDRQYIDDLDTGELEGILRIGLFRMLFERDKTLTDRVTIVHSLMAPTCGLQAITVEDDNSCTSVPHPVSFSIQ